MLSLKALTEVTVAATRIVAAMIAYLIFIIVDVLLLIVKLLRSIVLAMNGRITSSFCRSGQDRLPRPDDGTDLSKRHGTGCRQG